jgi:lipoyl(octanoyl) transferase
VLQPDKPRDRTKGDSKVVFRSIPGLIQYEDARQLQLRLVEERARDQIPDTFLFLEHEPVITRGRGLQQPKSGSSEVRHMPLPVKLPQGIQLAESERGGDLTYHGPGQLVVYPICKLDGRGFGPERDVVGYLRKLEKVLMGALSDWDLAGSAKPDATGVWVGKRKVASIGIAVRKWVTYHGIALNCVNDLSPFRLISPCGFDPEVMASVSELNPKLGWSEGSPSWRKEAEGAFQARI